MSSGNRGRSFRSSYNSSPSSFKPMKERPHLSESFVAAVQVERKTVKARRKKVDKVDLTTIDVVESLGDDLGSLGDDLGSLGEDLGSLEVGHVEETIIEVSNQVFIPTQTFTSTRVSSMNEGVGGNQTTSLKVSDRRLTTKPTTGKVTSSAASLLKVEKVIQPSIPKVDKVIQTSIPKVEKVIQPSILKGERVIRQPKTTISNAEVKVISFKDIGEVGYEKAKKKEQYPPYLRLEELEDKHILSRLRHSSLHDSYATVKTEKGSYDLYIPGRLQNRGFNEDAVWVEELLGAELVAAVKGERARRAKRGLVEDFEDVRRYGRVVLVVGKNERVLVGVLSVCNDKWMYFQSTDKTNPYVLVRKARLVEGVVVCVRVVQWARDSVFPFGEMQHVLGDVSVASVQSEALLVANGVTWDHFGSVFDSELSLYKDALDELECAGRVDMRGVRVFSIDPETARDLDDALSVQRLDAHTYQVGVHIADVSHFIAPNSLVDVEACKRGTSVYLANRVISMLPRPLCEHLCSLNEAVDRYTLSVLFKVTLDGRVESASVCKTVIRSWAKLSYEHAMSFISKSNTKSDTKSDTKEDTKKDTKEDTKSKRKKEERVGIEPERVTEESSKEERDESIEKDILILHQLSRKLREERYKQGALTLNTPKVSFSLDASGLPLTTHLHTSLHSHQLIEEFMLLANTTIATYLDQHKPGTGLLRKHEKPQGLEKVKVALESKGILVDITSGASIQSSLNNLDGDVRVLARRALVKGMKRAEYFCSSNSKEKDSSTGFEPVTSLQKDSSTGFEQVTSLLSKEKIQGSIVPLGTPKEKKEKEKKGKKEEGIEPESIGSKEFDGHFALAVERYTHFTSPIRRYCDLIVHRQVTEILSTGPTSKTTLEGFEVTSVKYTANPTPSTTFDEERARIQAIAQQCNERKSSAKLIQDGSTHLYLCIYLNLTPTKAHLATILHIDKRFIEVEVEGLGVEGRVGLDEMVKSGVVKVAGGVLEVKGRKVTILDTVEVVVKVDMTKCPPTLKWTLVV